MSSSRVAKFARSDVNPAQSRRADSGTRWRATKTRAEGQAAPYFESRRIPGRKTMRTARLPRRLGGSFLFGSLVFLTGCATVPTGRVGIEWTPTQGTVNQTLGEGFHIISPFADVYQIDLREREQEEPLDVLANNGLDIKMTASILYQPIPGEVFDLLTQTGRDYYKTLVAPYVRSSARRVVGRYAPEEIYSTKREQIEKEIRQEVTEKMKGKHIFVNAILVREVHLPAAVQTAIQTKLEEEQKALQMQFVIERTRQEAERKRIEAGGIADFQAIISKGLSDKVIEWKGIDATEKLASSPNAKVIIIGSGKNGLPVILNTGNPETAIGMSTATPAPQ
jgi:regulator of protease activity HflC (stomatin/prohibitin superfamily)